MLHRTGRLELEESSVITVVSAPHRPEAFEAGRYAIDDALKAAAPIWKHEVWADGADWGTGANEVTDPRHVATGRTTHDRSAPRLATERRGGGSPRCWPTSSSASSSSRWSWAVAMLIRPKNDPVDSFRRQIDALSPEARKPTIDQVRDAADDPGDDGPDDS